MQKQENYNAKQIEVLEGLDPVKKRPGMYTDTTRPNHLLQEVIDNSIDEALAGYGSQITVKIHTDGSASVIDNGRGMPTDIHPEYKKSGVEIILTKLHAGAKFANKMYRFSGGLHGVGISVVNALSERLVVTVKRDGQVFSMEFSNGLAVSKLKSIDKCNKKDSGTEVRFWPNPQYFDNAKFSTTKLKKLLHAKAVILNGITINFVDENIPETTSWCYKNGLKQYLQEFTEGEHIPSPPFSGDIQTDDGEVSWAFTWSRGKVSNLVQESYVNLIPTALGGTHVAGMRTGIIDAVREFCSLHNLLPKNVKLNPEDIWDGLNYVLSLKMHDPQFSGQTKEKLSSREAAGFVASKVKDYFSLWLNQHPVISKLLMEVFINNALSRIDQDKTVVRKKISSGPALPGKLADCTSQDLDKTEIFFVEGKSAEGSVKQARDKEFQATLPLRGKILNTWEVSSKQVLASKEVHDISVAIGLEPGSDDLNNLRYGKVCILADADADGAHIATLLCALFLKHFRSLVKAGRVFVAMPPLYRLDHGKSVFYALDDSEKEHVINKIKLKDPKANINIQRFKGLGEMNPQQLRETTMNPDTRKLIKLTCDDVELADQLFDMLLSKKRSGDRKEWLETKGNLAEVE